MSQPSPSREQIFSRLFHATVKKYWKSRFKTTGILDAEGKAFLVSIDYPEQEFLDFIEDSTGIVEGALFWYRKAAVLGAITAQTNLGYLFANGLGVERDYAQAAFWYRKAAEKGDISAQSGLGYLYTNELGVDQDYTQAMLWYRKAAEEGNISAQNGLGYLYAWTWRHPGLFPIRVLVSQGRRGGV